MEGKTVRTRRYAKTAAAVVYEGDLVKRVAAGTLQVAAAGDTDRIVGVAARTSLAADGYVDIIDDAEATFQAQSDGTTAYAVADNGQNVDIAAGTPDTSLEKSGQLVDMATKGTTATLPLKIIGLAPAINGGENGAGVNALLLVKLNHVERGAGVAGI
jgi:hypothetical protein